MFTREEAEKVLTKALSGREGNELITYCAFSGVGKSTLTREIAWELLRTEAPRTYNSLQRMMIKPLKC